MRFNWHRGGSLGLALAAAAIILMAGCGPAASSSGTDSTSDSSSGDGSSPSPEDGASNVSLVVGGLPEFNAVLEKHKGKVVLVDFWATWCEPCVAEFPRTVKFSQQYAEQGLAAVSVSLDHPDDKEKALEFLKEQKAEFDNLLSEYSSQETAVKFGLDAGVPLYRLYDRQGKLRHVFCDQLLDVEGIESSEKIAERIEELIAEEAES